MSAATNLRHSSSVAAAVVIATFVAGTLTACASGGAGRHRSQWTPGSVSGGAIDSTGANTLFEALERLRPDILRARGATPLMPAGVLPSVFLNGAPHGDVRVLATLPTRRIVRVDYIRPGEARARFGPEHAGGIVYVVTR